MVLAEVNRSTMNYPHPAAKYDVLVIGGGAAGLSGALVLARSRRSVLVIDAGAPRNAPAATMHNFLSRDGMNPLALLEMGRAEVRGYGGQVLEGRVRSAVRAEAGFSLTLEDGRVFAGRRLLVTTGLVDQLPDVPGLRERWGRDVIHCPYCHGWEVRDQALGVLASGPMAVHQALLFRQLTADVVLFTHTGPALSDEQAQQLAARSIRVIDGSVAGLVVTDDHLTGICMADGTVVARQALAVGAPMVARAEVLVSLGVQPKPHPMSIGEFIPADATGLTDLPGVWVAGNVTDLSATVIGAAAQGVAAGAAINADLVAEDTRRAVNERTPGATLDQPHGADGHDHVLKDPRQLVTQEFWDTRYASADAIWSGNPNEQLVAQVADLAPGTALEVGAGEGADAIWLAERGWRVTAVDISPVALERAARRAAEAGESTADKITWQQADILAWTPPSAQFDLVSAHFVHLPKAQRDVVYSRLAAAVRSGGRLLIVGHHPSDLETALGRPNLPDWLFTAEAIAELLDRDEWELLVVAAPAREAADPRGSGERVIMHDAVLSAVRRQKTQS